MMTMDCRTTAGPVASRAKTSPSRKKANRRLFILSRLASDRLGQCALKRPSQMSNAVSQSADRDFRDSRPFCQRSSATLPSKKQTHPPIIGLLGRCRPSAVARFVIAVVIDTIDGTLWRRIAHVSVKVFELLPALTHADSPTPVVWVSAGFGAAMLHPGPDLPCTQAARAMPLRRAAQATARPRVTAEKIGGAHRALASAIAATNPLTIPSFPHQGVEKKNGQFVKSFARGDRLHQRNLSLSVVNSRGAR